MVYLEEGDVAALHASGVEIVDRGGHKVTRDTSFRNSPPTPLRARPYQHYMQKEIHEQPRAVSDTLEAVVASGLDIAGSSGPAPKQPFARPMPC